MRLITDKQHAQIVEAVEAAGELNYQRHCGYKTTEMTEPQFTELNLNALATLQAAPEVEVVGEIMPPNCGCIYKIEDRSRLHTPLYATKEPS